MFPASRKLLWPVLLTLIVVVSACSATTTGRELGEAPIQSATPTQTDAEVQQLIPLAEEGENGFSLSSPVFAPGAELPEAFTSVGGDISPPLVITGTPPGTVEIALLVTDVDNGDFVHWLVAGISPDTLMIDQGSLPPGAIAHQNGAGGFGWFAPSKSLGAVHRYRFQLFALANPLGLDPGHDLLATIDTIERNTLTRSSLLATIIG